MRSAPIGGRYDPAAWWAGQTPDREDWFAAYPWRTVAVHAQSRTFARALSRAQARLAQAMQAPCVWRLAVSCGKDSTALLAVAAELGVLSRLNPMSMRDDLCWPGEDGYLPALERTFGREIERVRVDLDLTASVMDSTDTRGKRALSAPWFDRAREAAGDAGVMWGLRIEESPHRAITLRKRGPVYQMADGWRAAPLSDWTALDVHAAMWRAEVMPHPVYGCIDPWADPMTMRHSWFIVGADTGMARRHYDWLARWWPDRWARAQELWPDLRSLM
jgi:hypothetical protein